MRDNIVIETFEIILKFSDEQNLVCYASPVKYVSLHFVLLVA